MLNKRMNNKKLGELIDKISSQVDGQPGFWRFIYNGHELMCITDERADRMRIMTPVEAVAEMKGDQLYACMAANFDRALDARYCIDEDYLWSAFIHPLGSLSPELFASAVEQVVGAKVNFGGDYSSGALYFGG